MTSSSSPANGLDPRQGERHRTTGGAVRLSAHARVRPLRDHPTPEPFTPRRHTSGSPSRLVFALDEEERVPFSSDDPRGDGRLPMLVHLMATPRPAQRGAIGDGSFLHLPGGLIATIGPSGLVVSRVGRGVAIPDTTTREGLARLARDGRRLRALLATRTGTVVRHRTRGRRSFFGRARRDDHRAHADGIDLLPSRDQAAAPPTSPPEPADPGIRDSISAVPPRSPQAPRRDGTTHPRPSPRMTRPTASRSGTRGSASARSGPTGPSRS